MPESPDHMLALVCVGVLMLVGCCAVLCIRLCSLCFPPQEPEARTELTDPHKWMVASYATQVVAAYPDPWDQHSPDVVVYRTWS